MVWSCHVGLVPLMYELSRFSTTNERTNKQTNKQIQQTKHGQIDVVVTMSANRTPISVRLPFVTLYKLFGILEMAHEILITQNVKIGFASCLLDYPSYCALQLYGYITQFLHEQQSFIHICQLIRYYVQSYCGIYPLTLI